MACTVKNWNLGSAISAVHVDWNVMETPPSIGSYTLPAYQMMIDRTEDNWNGSGYKKGKLKDSYFTMTGEDKCPERLVVMYFKVLELNENPLITAQHWVARPCPPFCEEGHGILLFI